MKKFLFILIGLVLVAGGVFAVENLGGASQASSVASKNISFACMQDAIEHRDSAMINAMDKLAADSKAALTARKDALKAAWAITDKINRSNAITKAWNTFKVSWKKAQTDFKNARRIAWSSYRAETKTCKLTVSTYDSSELADVINT
jgi:hypothetical protein